MSLASASVRRPVFASMLTLIVLVLGSVAAEVAARAHCSVTVAR